MNPHALYELVLRVHREYAPRLLYVTENGAAFGDVRDHHGRVRDPERIDYLAGYLDAVGRAIAAGVPVRGYFIWSLLDNFEWSLGTAGASASSTSTTRRSSGYRRRASTGTGV